jgi:membrane protein implicated in regulation of membrane protease activity
MGASAHDVLVHWLGAGLTAAASSVVLLASWRSYARQRAERRREAQRDREIVR